MNLRQESDQRLNSTMISTRKPNQTDRQTDRPNLFASLAAQSKCRVKLILRLICYLLTHPRLKRSWLCMSLCLAACSSLNCFISFSDLSPVQVIDRLLCVCEPLGQSLAMKGDWVRSRTKLTPDLNSPFHDHHYFDIDCSLQLTFCVCGCDGGECAPRSIIIILHPAQ